MRIEIGLDSYLELEPVGMRGADLIIVTDGSELVIQLNEADLFRLNDEIEEILDYGSEENG